MNEAETLGCGVLTCAEGFIHFLHVFVAPGKAKELQLSLQNEENICRTLRFEHDDLASELRDFREKLCDAQRCSAEFIARAYRVDVKESAFVDSQAPGEGVLRVSMFDLATLQYTFLNELSNTASRCSGSCTEGQSLY